MQNMWNRNFRFMILCVLAALSHTLAYACTCAQYMHTRTSACMSYPWSEGWFQMCMNGHDRCTSIPNELFLQTCLWGLITVVIGQTQVCYLWWTLESGSSMSLNIIYSFVKKYSKSVPIKWWLCNLYIWTFRWF